ncbi:Chaperone protein ClpB1 [Citrus sinensis]|uniref:Chaperone protein ClpB1 n=1 Tax=Citrus sinensis TaxID=2711 RepID=A0ACB8LXL7_CITSI|nr:Chaperone protein ClpB1 [Citrus sinensis]
MLVAKQPTERVFDQAIKKLPSQTPTPCYIPASTTLNRRLFEDIQSADLLKKAGVAAARVKSEVEKSGDTTFKALETYGRDRVEQAGKLDPVIGCNEEIRRAVHILSRRTINNLFLLQRGGLVRLLWLKDWLRELWRSSRNVANLMKPGLARRQLRCIGAFPLSIRRLKERYESHHSIWIQDRALVDAAHLSAHYIAGMPS